MSRNDDYTTENLLDFLYHQNYYKLVGIDSSRKTHTSILQQLNSLMYKLVRPYDTSNWSVLFT